MAGLAAFADDIREHQVLAEITYLKLHPVEGVFLAPRQDGNNTWDGVLFPKDGPYRRCCLKFSIATADKFELCFETNVFHPYVADNIFKPPNCPHRLHALLTCLQASISDIDACCAHEEPVASAAAKDAYLRHPVAFQEQIEDSIQQADQNLFDASFSLKFSKYDAAHGHVLAKVLEQHRSDNAST